MKNDEYKYYRYYKVSLTFEFTFFSRKVKNDEYKLVLRVRKVKGRSILRVLSLLQSKPYFRIHFFSQEKWKMMSANWSVVWEKWKEGPSCKYYRYYKVSLTFEFTFFSRKVKNDEYKLVLRVRKVKGRSILRVLSLLQSKPYFRIHFFSLEKWKMMSTNWSFVWEKWKEGPSCEYYRYYKVSLTFELTFFSRKVKNYECKLVRRVRKVKGRSFLQVLWLLQSKPYFRIHFFL